MKKRLTLGRRAFLTGIGGTIVGLPILESMLNEHGEAFAQDGVEIPKKYVVAFGGHSLGADNDNNIASEFAPMGFGPDYTPRRPLEPLDEYNVREHVTVVSNLEIDWAGRNGGQSPPGGRHDGFHLASMSPLLSGTRSLSDLGSRSTVRGITSDQIVADQIAINPNRPSLVYRVQASWYLDVSAPYGRDWISYRGDGDPIDATVSPSQAFMSIFQGFTPPDPVEAERAAFMLRGRQSVLDLVRSSYERLHPNLSAYDQQLIEKHFDEIRSLEMAIRDFEPMETEICRLLDDPGADPIIGGNNSSTGGDGFDTTKGYSNEEERAALMTDIVHMAMACQITNVASLQYTMAQSHMNAFPIAGVPYDLHEVGHATGDTTKVSEVIAWHVGHWSRLVQKFADTNEGASSMIDNSAIVYLCEGGKGYDPEQDRGNSTHSTESMGLLVAGHVGGLNAGIHLDGQRQHPAQALISTMKAVGADVDTLGEVSGELTGLRNA